VAVNRQRPHLFIVPEDDACRQIVNGFVLKLETPRQIQIEAAAGGWIPTRDKVLEEHVPALGANPNRHVLVVVDFDHRNNRFEAMLEGIPENLRDRVFVLGSGGEPEDLKRAFNLHFEATGKALAEECRDDQPDKWTHELLSHNASELTRMRSALGAVLFPT
jgi:hypothetical protein